MYRTSLHALRIIEYLTTRTMPRIIPVHVSSSLVVGMYQFVEHCFCVMFLSCQKIRTE